MLFMSVFVYFYYIKESIKTTMQQPEATMNKLCVNIANKMPTASAAIPAKVLSVA